MIISFQKQFFFSQKFGTKDSHFRNDRIYNYTDNVPFLQNRDRLEKRKKFTNRNFFFQNKQKRKKGINEN